MNRKGTLAFVYFMVGVLFFLLGLALTPVLNEVIHGDNVMGVNGLDCSNESISNQNKAVCYMLDSFSPLVIGLLFGFGGIILARMVGW